MKFIGKKAEAYKCFADFRKDNDAKEYQQLVDIFLPMLFQENNHRLSISVGKRISESTFNSWLSWVTHSFIAMPTKYGNEPQLLIRDIAGIGAGTLLNLSLIENLHITTEDTIGFTRYNIDFHHDEADYQMHIVVNK